jgi:hypothetical protein
MGRYDIILDKPVPRRKKITKAKILKQQKVGFYGVNEQETVTVTDAPQPGSSWAFVPTPAQTPGSARQLDISALEQLQQQAHDEREWIEWRTRQANRRDSEEIARQRYERHQRDVERRIQHELFNRRAGPGLHPTTI